MDNHAGLSWLNKDQAFLGGNGSNTNKHDDAGGAEVEDMNNKDKFSCLSILSTYLIISKSQVII